MATIVERHENDLTGATSLAVFDPSRVYRYLLTRQWGTGPAATFVMLNPSTADALVDDATIRRCIGFARREGCGGIVVANLFALRAPNPHRLAAHPDPVGPDNNHYLAQVGADGPVIAAWGIRGTLRGRDATVAAILERGGRQLLCLGVTAGGHPRHPLYLPGTALLRPWGLL
jgi:hypothetical protein